MFENRGFWVFRVLAALLLIGALAAAGIMLYQAGQAQGYAMGLAAESSAAGQALTPDRMYPGWGYGGGFGRPFFFFPFGLFFCLIPLLFFFLFGGLFRAFAWRGHPGAWGPGPGGHGHWHTHPHPHGPQPEGPQPQADPPAENR